MYDKDLTIEPFTDRMAFTMDATLIDWDLVDEMSYAEPSSKEYRRLMKKLNINGRNISNKRRLRDDYDE